MSDGPAHQHFSQDRIWSHFQTVEPEAFAAAIPRLKFLVRSIGHKVKTARPVVLNIGVGSGAFEQLASAKGWEVHSLDPDAVAINKLTEAGIHGHVGYIERMELANATFDAVIASEVLEHLSAEQRSAGMAEIARVLKPTGWFLGTVPYNEDLKTGNVVCPCCGAVFHRWGHQASFTLERMRQELEPHFVVNELRRTAFVSFGDRGVAGKVKSAARWLLARWGQMIASPSIYWAARVRN